MGQWRLRAENRQARSLYNNGFQETTLNLKRIVLPMGILLILCFAGLVLKYMLPRPPQLAAELIAPILRDRIHADDAHYSAGSPEWDLEERLEGLTKNTSSAADVASVILLDYYLGEHNGETQLCAVTSRGPRVMPLLAKYRNHRAGLLRPWYLGIALNKDERESMYATAADAIQHGKIIGCE